MRLRDVRWRQWLALTGVLVLALWVRCAHLGKSSLWGDEFFSLECSSGWGRSDLHMAGLAAAAPNFVALESARPWTTIWSSVGADENHPPLYFLLLRAWRELFGDSAIALRSLSVLASLIAIVLLFAVVVTLHGPTVALWACLLMTLASPQIEQSQDARAYMPMTAACLVAALALARMDRFGPSWPRVAGLCLAALAAPMLHYIALATILAMIIYAVFGMRGPSRSAAVLSLGAAMGIFCLIWGPQFVSQHDRMLDDTAWMLDEPTHHLRSVLYNVCTIPVRFFLDLGYTKPWIGCFSIAAFGLPVALYRANRNVLLWTCWLLVPVGFGLLVDVTLNRTSLALVKYSLAAAPAVYVMLGLFATQMRRTGWIPAAAIAGCGFICIPCNYESTLPDWREISRFISHTSRPGDPVVFVDARPDAYRSESLLSASYYLPRQSHPMFVVDRPPVGKVLESLSRARHVCVIGDTYQSLTESNLPGLAIDHVELLAGMALVASADPPAQMIAKANPPLIEDHHHQY